MIRAKTSFRCGQCGYQNPRQLGRCPECKTWNSMQEERTPEIGKGRPRGPDLVDGRKGPLPLAAIESSEEMRLLTKVGEFDRVLGGGVVTGSVTLVGGDPGIGKTTLLLQILPQLADGSEQVLYVSGEESPRQIKMRCERLGIQSHALLILPETNLEEILKTASETAPAALVIDSIQTTFSSHLTSAPGSVSQVQEVAAQVMFFAKRSGTPAFLIGHVTKDGAIAGPRTLEHIVDTVLYFEGEKGHAYRILRAVKNRFGLASELEESRGEAIEALMSDESIAEYSADTLRKLEDKHPCGSCNVEDLSPDLIANALKITEGDVRKAIGTFSAGSSGGPDGLRPLHLKALVGCKIAGLDLISDLTAFSNMLFAGMCSPEVAKIFFLVRDL